MKNLEVKNHKDISKYKSREFLRRISNSILFETSCRRQCMKKIIFCNLDLLKRKNLESEYPDYDFTNFDYEQLSTKRMLFSVC